MNAAGRERSTGIPSCQSGEPGYLQPETCTRVKRSSNDDHGIRRSAARQPRECAGAPDLVAPTSPRRGHPCGDRRAALVDRLSDA